MSPRDDVRIALGRLLAEAPIEVQALDRRREELAHGLISLDLAVTRATVASLAVDLHGYYTAAEALFERIARHLDGSAPAGSDAHRELLRQMAVALPPVRDAVLDAPLLAWLHRLRSFRHFFRHAYAVDLDAAEVRAHAAEVLVHHPALRERIDAQLAHVRAAAGALDDLEP